MRQKHPIGIFSEDVPVFMDVVGTHFTFLHLVGNPHFTANI